MCHGTRIPLPWYPYPYTHGTPCLLHTYIHVLIHLFYLFIYFIVFVFVYLIVFVSLALIFSLALSSRSLLALGKACLWAGAAGLIPLVCANILFYLIIIQQYTCMVWYVHIHMYCIVYVYVSSIIHVSNRCGYVHSVVCTVLCACGPVYVQQYTCCAVQYGLPMHGMPLVYSLCVSHTYCTQCAIYSLVCLSINKKALCIIHNAYIKLILISNIFYLFWRGRKMRGHTVVFQNSGNTFVVCFSDIFEIKKLLRISEIVLWGVVFREKNFFCFDFDFALDNFDTKSILNFGFTKLSFNLRFQFYKKISNIYQFQNYR